mgnify:CR=1 FL=1
MRKKAVPVGIEDFERIIREDYYYVDKTMLIEELLINRAPVTLFTRPRRFGKTLNMSMIKYFFDVKNKEKNKKLFENLKIYNSEYMSEQGKYPVIFISLKDLKGDTWGKCFENLKKTMYKIFNEYEFVREKLNMVEKREFDKIWEMKDSEENFKTSLLDLSNYLNKYYGEKAIILIDEYDAPIINAFDKGYYNEAINFFQTFYSSALKTNNSLKYGVLTGITRIIKEGIFSGLNNLKVNTIFSEKYSEYYGLTEEEVLEAVKYYDMEYEMQDIRKWYDGYQFGKSEVYNPWSIINFLNERELKAYWIGVSGNSMINDLLSKGDRHIVKNLEKLFNEEIIYKAVRDYTEYKFDSSDIWELFLYSGYLTIAGEKQGEEYPLRLPNKEIQSFFRKIFIIL